MKKLRSRFGWLPATRNQIEQIMGQLEDTLAQLKELRLLVAKIRSENTDTRKALSDRIKALEDIIAAGTIDPVTLAALKTEVDGFKADLEAFDTDVPDAPTPPA